VGKPLATPLDTYLGNVEPNDSRKIDLAKAPVKQNPKSEYRNPKQTEAKINPKFGKSKTPNPNEARFEFFLFLVI